MKYIVDFTRFNEHLVDIHLNFKARVGAPTLWLPTWIAGSYLIREFSKNITLVQYDHDDTRLDAVKRSKNTYELTHIKAGDVVDVHYEVYCHDLSVRTAFLDNTRLFGNFSSLLVVPTGQESDGANISLHVPNAFYALNPNATLACGLKHTCADDAFGKTYHLEPVAAFDSYDYPFEISIQDEFAFTITDSDGKDLPHRFFIAGKHHGHLPRLQKDIQRICQAYLDELGSAPFKDYTFMTMVTGSDYGGLEHINSTALVSPRTDLPSTHEGTVPSGDYQRYLGLCSHEYFHAWWVKTVRPDVMMDSQLQTEAPSPLLWVFEGFTSYIDDLMLLRSGVIDKASYLKLLAAQINRYYQTAGRDLQSVAESSFDAWIKLYRPDENSTNQGVSYYNKGALIALLLDLTLLKHSDGKYRLFDVVRAFYAKALEQDNRRFGMTHENLGKVVGDMIGCDVWQVFFDDYVIGRQSLPIEEMLAEFGIEITATAQHRAWGMTTEELPSGIKIKHLIRQSPASKAGLSANDVIVAIDGLKASQKLIESTTKRQNHDDKPVVVHAFRRDELMTFNVHGGSFEYRQVSLVDNTDSIWLN